MKNRNKSTLMVLLIAAALVIVLLLDTFQVFRLTSDLTRSAGRYHLESISGAGGHHQRRGAACHAPRDFRASLSGRSGGTAALRLFP